MATKPANHQVVQQIFGTDTPPPVETDLDSENGNTPWAAALSARHPLLPRVLRVLVAATINYRAYLHGPSTPSSIRVSTCTFLSQSHQSPIRAENYEGDELKVISHPALSKRQYSGKGTLALIFSL